MVQLDAGGRRLRQGPRPAVRRGGGPGGQAEGRLAARKGGRPPIEPGPDFWDRIEELSEAEVNAIPESVFDAQTLRTCDAIEAQNAILPVPTIYLEIAARNRERVMARIAARAAARC
jgi:hypothetical protein